MTWDAAMAALSAPGAPFELKDEVIRGQKMRVYAAIPPSLRGIYDVARTRADQAFLVYEDEEWSFGDVLDHAAAFGSALVEHYKVQPGDRVAIAMRNFPEWIAAFIGITSVGGVSVSLNAWWTEDEMAYGLEDCGAKVLVADRERLERAQPCLARLGIHSVAVRSDGSDLPAIDALALWQQLVTPQVGTATMPEVEIAPEDDATILYTSGTTGFPKGAVSTHRAVLSALASFGCGTMARAMISSKDSEGRTDPTSLILVVPLFHVTGCVAVMLSCVAAGYKLVMMHKWNPERALELIERERVTMFVGVPTQSWDLLESPDFASRDTSSLASIGGGGAPAPPELVKRVDSSFSGRPGIGYGMTETNAYGPQNGGDDYVRKPTSSGRPVPALQMRVTDEEGNELGTGEVGEIWFRGPMVIRGYWNKPEATAETIVDGWLRSGDLGRIDEEGFVYVQDRAKDMVLRGGENVYCAEVEAAIYEHPAVYEAAVFGLPHARLGEEVAAAILLKDGAALEADALRAFVAERIASFKVPSQIEFHSESLPRNASGKILKRQIRDEWAERL